VSRTKQVLLAVAITLSVIAGVILIWGAGAKPTHAALVQQGTPVRCVPAANPIPADRQYKQLTCYAPDGTSFLQVPAGRYLLVTDLVATDNYEPGPGYRAYSEVTFRQVSQTGPQAEFKMKSELMTTYSQHFNTPYFVLPGGDHLEALVKSTWTYVSVHAYATGLLVTDFTYSYIPVLTGNK
jgi:hypothetical protein